MEEITSLMSYFSSNILENLSILSDLFKLNLPPLPEVKKKKQRYLYELPERYWIEKNRNALATNEALEVYKYHDVLERITILKKRLQILSQYHPCESLDEDVAPNSTKNINNSKILNNYCTKLSDNALRIVNNTSKDEFVKKEMTSTNIYKLFPDKSYCQLTIKSIYQNKKLRKVNVSSLGIHSATPIADSFIKKIEPIILSLARQVSSQMVTEVANARKNTSILKFSPRTILEMYPADENGMVTLGTKGTKLRRSDLEAINWQMDKSFIVSRIVGKIFDRRTLANNSLSGKITILNHNRPAKGKLDPNKVSDIILFLTHVTYMTVTEIRAAISAKCSEASRVRNMRNRTDDE